VSRGGPLIARWASRAVAAAALCAASAAATSPPVPPPAVDGHSTIRAPAGASEIVITTTDRLAGAIHSLTWNGREFIDSHDHGRQLQSAASFDCGLDSPFWAERFNPTEAGARADGTGPTSTSRLLELRASGNELTTRSRLAFWLAPGEQSYGRPALNRTPLSDHHFSKRVRIGLPGLPHVVEYHVTFTVPEGELHSLAQFEALTGYMPPGFSKFWTFQAESGRLEPLDDGPGEQRHPVVFSTPDETFAMGVIAAPAARPDTSEPGYGRFRFSEEAVVKWNCVFRARHPSGVSAGDYSFRLFVAVGSLEDVRHSFMKLAAPTRPHAASNPSIHPAQPAVPPEKPHRQTEENP
jgi:hypothetical protein